MPSPRRVATAWMRQAIQQKYIDEVLEDMPPQGEAFDDLFEGKKRLVIRDDRLQRPFPEESSKNLKSLANFYVAGVAVKRREKDPDAKVGNPKIDLKEGLVRYEENGRPRKIKIGKMLRQVADASRKVLKSNLPAHLEDDLRRATSSTAKEERKLDRQAERFGKRWPRLLDELGSLMGMASTSGPRLYPDGAVLAWQRVMGEKEEAPREDEWDPSADHQVDNERLDAKTMELLREGDEQVMEGVRRERDAMLRVLDPSDEDLRRLREVAEEYEKKSKEPEKTRETRRWLKDRQDVPALARFYERTGEGGDLASRFSGRDEMIRLVQGLGDAATEHHDARERATKALERVGQEFEKDGKSWMKDILDRGRKADDVREAYEQYSSGSQRGALVLSRAPVDVLRMSDHPGATQSMESCHSEGGSYFQCAINEAKGTGLVAYLVNEEDLDKIDLDDDEIFKDQDRDVDGIVPRGRVRLRRFENKKDGSEVAIPELNMYGENHPGVLEVVTDWAREKQPKFMQSNPKPSDYVLTGGSTDSPSLGLWDNMLGEITQGRSPERQEKPSSPEEFWDWMRNTVREVDNPNPDGREKTVSIDTLKDYATSRQLNPSTQPRAQKTVRRYLKMWRDSA